LLVSFLIYSFDPEVGDDIKPEILQTPCA
jgi:hypothetical protein